MPIPPSRATAARPLLSTRKIVHMSMLIFAFLLPFLTWVQAAGCAVLALLFNLFLLPRLQVDVSKQPGGPAQTTRFAGSDTEFLPYPAGTWTGIILYPISVLMLILLYRHHLHVAASAWAIMALGDGMASVVGEGLGGPAPALEPGEKVVGFRGFVSRGQPELMPSRAGSILVADGQSAHRLSPQAALVGALVETVPIRLDDNVSVPLVSGAFLFCAYLVERSALDSNLPFLGRRILLAVAINAAFALWPSG